MTIPKRFQGLSSSVIVSVAFDTQTDHLLKTAINLCRHTKMSLRLVHVNEPWAGRHWAGAVSGGVPMLDVIAAVELEQCKAALSRLDKIASSIAAGIDCSTNVLTGPVADCLIADALTTGASLIITGVAPNYSKFIPSGFSTAMSLMAHAPCPVLAVPSNCNLDFSKDGLKILLADDLSDGCLAAVNTAMDFATALKHADVTHLHVNAVDTETLQQTFNTAMATAHVSAATTFNLAELSSMMQSCLERKLSERIEVRSANLVKVGGKVTTKITVGVPHESIQGISADMAADIVVFGRHAALHRRPFTLGRVPLRAMLSQQHAVMVVPPFS